MLTAVDVGNTNIVLCQHDGVQWGPVQRFRTNTEHFPESLTVAVSAMEKSGRCVLCSVVPPLTDVIADILEERFGNKPLIIGNDIETGLIRESLPADLGSDILCNMIAAHHFYPDEYVTVADFGTAFTTSTVSPEGRMLGVTIAPGLMTSVKALFNNTYQIPSIKLDLPETVLGTDTISSIRAGVVFGFTGQLNAVVEQIEKEINHSVRLIATGGFSSYIKPYVPKISKTDIFFTLEGARTACELNG
ncbi:MAG: type III pantothenate kinase [Sphaerochaetaceae bacterium]|nr:type III pantothenate kinase [Sphaerochaetaceae bacterium]